jgi:peptide deformylase
LVDSMLATLRDAPGVGLAANQVGLDMQLLVVEVRERTGDAGLRDLYHEQGRLPVEPYAIVNPALQVLDAQQALWFEGCLSVPGYTAIVPRARSVEVTGYSVTGEEVRIVAEGWHARVLQHECDHLNGTLYVDRMVVESFMSRDAYVQHWHTQPIADVLASLHRKTGAP